MKNNELNSNDIFECRYCLCEDNKENLIDPCNCQGTLKHVHSSCMGKWISKAHKECSLNYSKEDNIIYYSTICEICKFRMKYQMNFENSLFISLIYTLKNTFMSSKSFFFFIFHVLIIYYFFNRLLFLFYRGVYVLNKSFKTKYLIRFLNEMAIFSTILWYVSDVFKYYWSLLIEQRKTLHVFLPRNESSKINCGEFKFIDMENENN